MDDGHQWNATRLASCAEYSASKKTIVEYLRHGTASIVTASPATDLIENHQGASGPTSTPETSAKSQTAKHRASVLDEIAGKRALGYQVAVEHELAMWGRGTMNCCAKTSATTQGTFVLSYETLASEIENNRFDFGKFGRLMKNYCLNNGDSAVNGKGKTDIYYMSAEILASAVEDGSSVERFGIEMTLLCLTSP